MITSSSANSGILPGPSTSRTHDPQEQLSHRTARLTFGRSLSGVTRLFQWQQHIRLSFGERIREWIFIELELRACIKIRTSKSLFEGGLGKSDRTNSAKSRFASTCLVTLSEQKVPACASGGPVIALTPFRRFFVSGMVNHSTDKASICKGDEVVKMKQDAVVAAFI
jgi:hypothetical protein